MPVPAYLIPWIVGGLAREAGRRYGRRVGVAGAAGAAGYIASRFRKRKQGSRPSKQSSNMNTPNYGPGPSKRARLADGGTVRNRLYQDNTPGVIRDSAQGYAQLVRTKLEYGKVLSKTEKKMKMLGSKMMSWIERFQKVNPTAKQSGTFPLDFFRASAEDSAYLPLYTFDLTCVNNNYRSSDGTVGPVYPYPFRRLAKDPGDGGYYTIENAGRDADNTKDVYWWTTERSITDDSPVNVARDKSMIEWVDIRLLLYGASRRPSAVTVELWQFNEDEFMPKCDMTRDPNAGVLVTQTIETEPATPVLGDEPAWAIFNRWQNMWHGVLDSQIGNPIGKRGLADKNPPFSVLYSRRFDFQPIDLQEGDATGHQQEVHFRYNMNKVCSYDRNPNSAQVTTAELDDANEWDRELAYKTSPFTVPKGRVFLVVRGVTMENASGAVGGVYTVAPSFDMVVRRKRTVFSA